MKKTLLNFALLLSLTLFSTQTFAQNAPGDSGEGGGTPIEGSTNTGSTNQPLANHFTRNNGDGTCGGQAQIRMFYTSAPTAAPTLNQIDYNGEPLYSNFLPITGDLSKYATTGYVSFCLPTSNIPPAIKLTLNYNASSAQQANISGTD